MRAFTIQPLLWRCADKPIMNEFLQSWSICLPETLRQLGWYHSMEESNTSTKQSSARKGYTNGNITRNQTGSIGRRRCLWLGYKKSQTLSQLCKRENLRICRRSSLLKLFTYWLSNFWNQSRPVRSECLVTQKKLPLLTVTLPVVAWLVCLSTSRPTPDSN